jgi:hypothetical protein
MTELLVSEWGPKFDHNIILRVMRVWDAEEPTTYLENIEHRWREPHHESDNFVIYGRIDQVSGKLSTNDADQRNACCFDPFEQEALKWSFVGKAVKPEKKGLRNEEDCPHKHILQPFQVVHNFLKDRI